MHSILRTLLKALMGPSIRRLTFGLAIGLAMLDLSMAQTQLDIEMVPMLKLTGQVGTTNQIQYRPTLSPTNGWSILANVVLTNSAGYYVDISTSGNAQRIYQVVIEKVGITNTLLTPAGMVLIPSGVFIMGGSTSESTADELPVHSVQLSAFYMDKYEVTQVLWEEVYQWAAVHGYGFQNAESKAPNHPVHSLSWDDAVKWCNARSEKEGRTPAYYTDAAQNQVYRTGRVEIESDWVNWNGGYRLPTEAEWEYAARGGINGRRFPWGGTITHKQANYSSISAILYDISSTRNAHPDYAMGGQPFTSPVGSFAANDYSLHDMTGNVQEWCWDFYDYYSYDNLSEVNPKGIVYSIKRVARNGGWAQVASAIRCASRAGYVSGRRENFLGFRCVLGKP